ncbi:MAG: hypothetical protein AB1714_09290 [Acidobacteriota bacterium]
MRRSRLILLATALSASTLAIPATAVVLHASNDVDGWVKHELGHSVRWGRIVATQASLVYAAADAQTSPAGVFLSTDGGATWDDANGNLPETGIRAIAVDPLDSKVIYAALSIHGVYKSLDQGRSWNLATAGLPPDIETTCIHANPRASSSLLLGLKGGGVFVSTDGAGTWTRAATFSGDVTAIASDPDDGNVYYIGTSDQGVYRSADGGWTWLATQVGQSGRAEGPITAIVVDPSATNNVYLATASDGIWKSTDAGDTWARETGGLNDSRINDLILDSTDASILYAATASQGVFTSIDGGAHWVQFPTLDMADMRVLGLALDRTDGDRLYAWTPTALYVYRMQAAPRILKFRADPENVSRGESSTLSWTVANATSCTIDHRIGHVRSKGRRTVSPRTTTTYTLTAKGKGGAARAQVTVTVGSGRPIIESFAANPSAIVAGSSTTLSWATKGATRCALNHGIGEVPTSGSVVVSPSATTTYTLRATGSGGVTAWSVTVSVSPIVIDSFSATPSAILVGSSATLSWSTQGATHCALDNLIGEVPTSGSVVVSPSATTVYTLTASGSGGTTTKTTTVTVTAIYGFAASPASINTGDSTTLSWQAGGTSASIDHGIGGVPINGSIVVSPATTTTYTLTAWAPGGFSVTAAVTVLVNQLPTIDNLTAAPDPVESGQQATITFTLNDPEGDTMSWTATVSNGGGGVLDVTAGSGVSSGSTVTVHFTSSAVAHVSVRIDVSDAGGATNSATAAFAVKLTRSVVGTLTRPAPGTIIIPGLFVPVPYARVSSASTLMITATVTGSTFSYLAVSLANAGSGTYTPFEPLVNGLNTYAIQNDGTNNAWFGLGLPGSVYDGVGFDFSAGAANLNISWVWQ